MRALCFLIEDLLREIVSEDYVSFHYDLLTVLEDKDTKVALQSSGLMFSLEEY